MLYIHIPFCKSKCHYCDFLSFPAEEKINDYISALCNEISLRNFDKTKEISSIYIGGGTPNILPPAALEKLFSTIFKYYTLKADCEITIELNPGILSDDFIAVLNYLPVNRASIGLQSANNNELNLLGRIHNFSDFLKTYDQIIKSEINNINVDIMTGIPGQSTESLENTLKLVTGLRPDHISCYALILEENTLFHRKYKPFHSPLPDEELEYRLYRLPIDYLNSHGYNRYEISNFSRNNKDSRHNLGYWDRVPYLGLGLGAASLHNHIRYKNTTDLNQYIRELNSEAPHISEDFYIEKNPLSLNDEMSEFMFLGLRKTSGILFSKFYEHFKLTVDSVFHNEIEYLLSKSFIEQSFAGIKLTDLGMDLSNQVLARFLLDEL